MTPKDPFDYLGFAVMMAGPTALALWLLTIPYGWLMSLWLVAHLGPCVEEFFSR